MDPKFRFRAEIGNGFLGSSEVGPLDRRTGQLPGEIDFEIAPFSAK